MRAIVTQRESLGPHGEPIDSLEREYVDFLTGMGFEVFPISSFTEDAGGFFEVVKPDIVVLTGGGIVQLDAYRNNVSGWHQTERDAVEEELVSLALNVGVPILGICRGMHKLNAFFGGRTSNFDGMTTPRDIGSQHPVEFVDMRRFDVNHFHRDGLYPSDLGDGFELLAWDPDNGTVEAACNASFRLICVQWHPERMPVGEAGRIWVEAEVRRLVGQG